MSDEDDTEEWEAISDTFLSRMPPRVALAYKVIEDGPTSDKGIVNAAKQVLRNFLSGEDDHAT